MMALMAEIFSKRYSFSGLSHYTNSALDL